MKKIIRASTIPLSLELFCRGLLREMSEQYEVVALSSPGELLDIVEKREGVRCIRINMERHISPLKDLVSLWRIIKTFRREKPDIVHSMTPKAGLLCMMAGWMTGVPVRVHTFTGLVFPSATGLKRRILIATDRLTCCCATHVIPEGEGVKNDMLNNHITKKPLKVLGHGNVRGVDMEYYDRTPEVMRRVKQLRDDTKMTFIFVGRVGRDKGIEELCKAFDRLSKEHDNLRLWIVGPDENDVDPIPALARAIIDHHPEVHTLGMQREVNLLAYYAAADCFVLPSYREGFPNTVLEAGAMGLPSIVTDINGSREIVKEGENGLIVPPHDADALYYAMKQMTEKSQERQHMADNARKMVADRFEQGYVRQCLYDFYNEILS
ncbi:MAG: glycosyltransferase family 4 protein [Prevotella sp.]|nr:glycosyltransferase family 4 protein [Prevotella sp.]